MIGPILVVLCYAAVFITCGVPRVEVVSWPKILFEVGKGLLVYFVSGFILLNIYMEIILPWSRL